MLYMMYPDVHLLKTFYMLYIAGLSKLTKLDLSTNAIRELDAWEFRDVPLLEELQLQYNLISFIHIDAFKGKSECVRLISHLA